MNREDLQNIQALLEEHDKIAQFLDKTAVCTSAKLTLFEAASYSESNETILAAARAVLNARVTDIKAKMSGLGFFPNA